MKNLVTNVLVMVSLSLFFVPASAAVTAEASAVIPACGKADADPHAIGKQKNKDSLYAVLTYRYLKRAAYCRWQVSHNLCQTAADIRSCQHGKPHNRKNTKSGED